MRPDTADPDELPQRRWKRAGRDQFVSAAVAYLDGLGDSAANRGTSGPDGAGRADDAGPAELGIRLVASLLGKSPSAPLFHFPDRLTLFAAVAAEGFRRLTVSIQPCLAESTADPAKASAGGGRPGLAYVDWAGAHPALFALMYTPALAPGVDAIQSGDEAYWEPPSGGGSTDATIPITEPAGRRRFAFQELHDAKAAAAMVFWTAVEQAQRTGALSRATSTVDAMNAIVAMADGLAWQRVNERQQTPAMMRRHAERSIQILMSGLG